MELTYQCKEAWQGPQTERCTNLVRRLEAAGGGMSVPIEARQGSQSRRPNNWVCR